LRRADPPAVGPASVLNLCCALLSAAAAVCNFWLWRERRNEPAHLWLALAAASVGLICLGKVMVYEASTLAGIELWQRLQLAAAGPLMIGFFRFSFLFLGVERPRIDRLTLGIGCAVALASLTPWAFDGVPHARSVPWLGQHYREMGLGVVGQAFFASCGVLFCWLLAFYGRNLARLEDQAMNVFAALCLWVTFSLHDMCVTVGLFSGPYLLGLGYVAFVAAFSALLMRRLVRSSEEVERQAETLQQLVDERTAELREKELQVAHGQRLATLSTLAASCAHELNNPAAYVTSSLNRLAELWKGSPGAGNADGEAEDLLAECREGVERIRAIVGDLLALARRSDGERGRVDLAAVVESALPVVRNEARYRVEIVPALRPVPAVSGDGRLLGQVVVNLVLNGIQAAAAAGRAEARVGVETSFEDGSVWLVVRDNGKGIPEELRPHLFDPFFPRRARGGRVGLGLAVTHQIVTSHGGRIDVESGASGTTVIVELPASLVSDPDDG
jgi:signal transduction histidine kinase